MSPTWFLAWCPECGPLPQPFRDPTERDRWAAAHATTGHAVWRAERDDEPSCMSCRDAPAPGWECSGCGRVGEDGWCRREDCEYRNWQSGAMPTHRKGAGCPDD